MLSTHQGTGIGVFLRMRKKEHKSCGDKQEPFLCLVTGYKKIFHLKELKIKMSPSVQRSVVESFKFNDKSIRALYIKDVGQSLISHDVYTAVGYDKENVVKTIQQLVPEK